MAKIAHPEMDLAPLFEDIDRRLKALESPPGPALGTLLAQATPSQGNQAGTNTPAAPGGFGGEFTMATLSFTLTRAAQVMLITVYQGYENVASGPFITNDGFYFQIDGTDQLNATGTLPKGQPTASIGGSFAIIQMVNLAVGAHTVSLIWNSQEGATDTLHGSGVLYALLMS